MNCLAIDIGGTYIKYACVDRQGHLTHKGKKETPKTGIQEMALALTTIVKSLQESGAEFVGIGLSVPAPIDVKTGIIYGEGSLPFLYHQSLKALLEEAIQLPVACENDGNCAALAEVWAGAGKHAQDLVLIVCGTGIGGAIVKDKKVHHGKNLYAGEFGYGIHQYEYGRKKIEIWSELASTGGLIHRVAVTKGIEEASLTGEDVFKMAFEGDAVAIEAVDRFYTGMAIGIHNIQYYYDPELILIGGAISGRRDFIEKVTEKLCEIYEELGHPKVRPVIKTCHFLNDANLIGAAYHYWEHIM